MQFLFTIIIYFQFIVAYFLLVFYSLVVAFYDPTGMFLFV